MVARRGGGWRKGGAGGWVLGVHGVSSHPFLRSQLAERAPRRDVGLVDEDGRAPAPLGALEVVVEVAGALAGVLEGVGDHALGDDGLKPIAEGVDELPVPNDSVPHGVVARDGERHEVHVCVELQGGHGAHDVVYLGEQQPVVGYVGHPV